jgi:hypothetical protein
VLKVPAKSLAEAPVQKLIMNAAVDLMPRFAREMHALPPPMLAPIVRSGTYGMARAMRWAFAGEQYRRSG